MPLKNLNTKINTTTGGKIVTFADALKKELQELA